MRFLFKIKIPIFLLLALFPSARGFAAPADAIFFGGTIVTVNEKQNTAEAMAVSGGKIAALGSMTDIKSWQGPQTRMIDLKGQTLMPGFFEPHGHPFDAAFAQFYAVDIRPFSVKDAATLDQKIKTAVAAAKPGAIVLINGLDPVLQKGVTAPTMKQLNEWAPKNPLVIIANSGHAAYGNALAFQAAGITAQTPDPPGGHFGKTPDGQLSGTVDEIPAMVPLLGPVLNGIGPEKMVSLLKTYYAYIASHGITTVSDMTFAANKLPVYQALAQDPNVQVRLRLYEMARKDNKGTLPPFGGTDLVRQNGIKWWGDGSPWQGSIAVSEPFLNNDITLKVLGLKPNNRGTLNYPNTPELQSWVEAYFQQGYQIAIHVEGDVAIEQALDVMTATLKKFPNKDHRMRLEHVPLITEKQVARAHAMGIPVSFLMGHIYYWGDILPEIVGKARADHWNPTGWAHKNGIPYTFHNDGPVTPADPLLDMQIAVLRKTDSGKELGPVQRVTIDEAIRARTINAARELFMEKDAGSLEVGKWADLVVLSGDPQKVKPEEISKIKVNATYLNGKQVWPSPAP